MKVKVGHMVDVVCGMLRCRIRFFIPTAVGVGPMNMAEVSRCMWSAATTYSWPTQSPLERSSPRVQSNKLMV